MEDSKNMQLKQGKNISDFLPVGIGIGLILLILILVLFLPCPTNSQFIIFRIVIAIAVAGLASILPGFLKIQYNKIVSAGGALAVFVFAYIFTPQVVNTTARCDDFIDFTIFIEGDEGKTIPQNKGKLILRVGNDKRIEALDQKGAATFKQLPSSSEDDTLTVELDLQGWQFSNGHMWEKIVLAGKSTLLKVRKDESLCCVSGSVRDANNHFVKDVKVSIKGIVASTDENGRFELKIPQQKQQEEQTLTAYKEGYVIWEDHVFPSTQQEIKIILQKN